MTGSQSEGVLQSAQITSEPVWNSSTQASLLRAVSGLSLLAVVGAVFAFLREVTLATAFGAGESVDAYLVAVAVPFMLSTSIISTLEAAFIPVYLSCKADGSSERAERMASATHAWLLVVGIAATVGQYAVLPILLPLQAPGFPDERLALARTLAWFTIPSILFAGLYALGRSVLNAERRFFAPALAPGISACVMITAMLSARQALGVRAAAVGYTAGMAALWLTVYVPIMRAGLPGSKVAWDWHNPDMLRLPRAVAPLLLGVTAMSAIPVIDRLMASRFPAGVISALSYADKIVQVPIALVATAVTTATFPTLALYAARRDLAGLRRAFAFGVKAIAVPLVPIAVMLWVLNHEVVAVLLERGRFTSADARTTAVALAGYATGLAFMGIFQMVPRVFNAMQLASFVALSGLLNLGFKIAFNLLFVPALGYLGFALATSGMYMATGGIMLLLLRQKLEGLELKMILPVLGRTFACATLTVVVVYGATGLLHSSPPLTRLLLSGSAASAAYIGSFWAMSGRMGRARLARLRGGVDRGKETSNDIL